jgi:hypothetical protein
MKVIIFLMLSLNTFAAIRENLMDGSGSPENAKKLNAMLGIDSRSEKLLVSKFIGDIAEPKKEVAELRYLVKCAAKKNSVKKCTVSEYTVIYVP